MGVLVLEGSVRSTHLEAARSGDHAAFELLLAPHLDAAFRLAARLLEDAHGAEDALQEAAVKAWRGIARYRGDEAGLKAWFLAIVVNEARMARRGRWWSVLRMDQPEPSSHADSHEALVINQIDLRAALKTLNQADWTALYLHFYADLSFQEVGRVLGIREGAARVRVHRAVKRLRGSMASGEVSA